MIVSISYSVGVVDDKIAIPLSALQCLQCSISLFLGLSFMQ